MKWNGVNIKAIAKEKGLTLKQLAADIGVSRQSVNDWINGQLPKGSHLVMLCQLLKTTPNAFFNFDTDAGITVPAHRSKGVAKVTTERQEVAYDFAREYSVFFRNIEQPSIVPVIRAKDRSQESAKFLAQQLRKRAGVSKGEPITREQTFMLMEDLGIYLIIKEFPDAVKAYAFYTNIHSYRVVFVDYNTKVIDLVFALLHEAIHAIRDGEGVEAAYDKAEEDFCDLVANYIQFPDAYIEFVWDSISALPRSYQVNQLKTFGEKHWHALYGLVKQIKKTHPSFSLKTGGADTNFKKNFKSIGEWLFADHDPEAYLDTLVKVSPVFIGAVLEQYDGLSDRRLGDLLGVDHILDAKAVRGELNKLKSQRV